MEQTAPKMQLARPDLRSAESVAQYLRERTRVIENFPKPGHNFADVTTLLADPEAFQVVIDALRLRYSHQHITHIVSCEARGFIFGAPLALALQAAFVPVRRARRLPSDTVGVDYVSGFYSGRLEMHADAMPKGARVVIIDDLVATGNTLKVTCELVHLLGGKVVECGCVINSIRSTASLEVPVFGLMNL